MRTPRADVPAIWWRWLLVVAVIGVLFGLLLVFTPRLLDPLNSVLYDSVFGEGAFAALGEAERAYHDWTFGVTGATLIGWAALIAAAALFPFRQGQRWVWWALVIALLLWFTTDSLTSLLHGVWPNLLVNSAFLIAFGIPLVGSWRAFRTTEDEQG